MNLPRFTALVLIVASFVTGTVTATIVQERKTKKVTRVKRPEFSPRDWDGIYFENLFTDGLVGNRPESIAPGAAPTNSPSSTASNTSNSAGGESREFAWSNTISRTSIEDEVKSIQNKLATEITTPGKFKSGYASVNRSFSMLSMLFAIIREYDSDVRWKEYGAEAQISFERAAANSRVGTIQAYESCKRRRDMLTDMVRGGSFVGDEKVPESLDWSRVVDRSPLMERLEESMSRLKQLTSSKGEFTSEIGDVLQEAELVAAIALVLKQEEMPDAEDEGYADLAQAMHTAAMGVVEGCKQNNFDQASTSANMISQSCSNCHDEWR